MNTFDNLVYVYAIFDKLANKHTSNIKYIIVWSKTLLKIIILQNCYHCMYVCMYVVFLLLFVFYTGHGHLGRIGLDCGRKLE